MTVVVAGSHVKIPRTALAGKKIEVEITPKIYLRSIQLDASLNGPGVWRFVK